jgi:hypothetical protein
MDAKDIYYFVLLLTSSRFRDCGCVTFSLLSYEHLLIQEHEKQRAADKSSDVKWMQTVLTKGTLSDRVSAMTLAVSETPLYNLNLLAQLVAMCEKNNSRESGSFATRSLLVHVLLCT